MSEFDFIEMGKFRCGELFNAIKSSKDEWEVIGKLSEEPASICVMRTFGGFDFLKSASSDALLNSMPLMIDTYWDYKLRHKREIEKNFN